jgi:hypothetical protein
MSEMILKEDDMGWIAIRALASLLSSRQELVLIPSNLQEITEDNAFIADLRFYTGGYQEKELVQFFKRLEEFNIPVGLDESYGEQPDPDNIPF